MVWSGACTFRQRVQPCIICIRSHVCRLSLLPTSLSWCVIITSKLRTTRQGNLRWLSHRLHYSDLICIRLSLLTKRCSKIKLYLLPQPLSCKVLHGTSLPLRNHVTTVLLFNMSPSTHCFNASNHDTNLALPSHASCVNTSASWNTVFHCCRNIKDKLFTDWSCSWCVVAKQVSVVIYCFTTQTTWNELATD
jgi:hypothetical protein